MENDDLAQLEELLCADLDDRVEEVPKLSEVDIFTTETAENSKVEEAVSNSVVHGGDTDSSDDEEHRNYTERKYDNYGSQIKKILNNQEQERLDKKIEFETRLRQTNIDVKVANNRSNYEKEAEAVLKDTKFTLCAPEIKGKVTQDVYSDPIFGIRIARPLISSSALTERMQGREAITLNKVKRHVEHGDLTKDWVLGGVIVKKSACKKSQKGSQFVIWTISDLKDDLKTVSIFLFRKAYNELWKTLEGTVIAILNPNVLDKSENSMDQACLSVDNPDRVMILGKSKDLGICKSRKKNGDPCTAFVNINSCEHCIYHVKQEYQKFSRRQELQSSTMGKGLVNLQNKLLGKSTMIYGGKAYSALTPAKSSKITKRDQNRLMSLSDYYKSESDQLMINKAPCGAGSMLNKSGLLHSPLPKRASDNERLNKLTNNVTTMVANSPKLGLSKSFGLKGSGTIDLNMSYGQKAAERTKINAISLIKKMGGLTKLDPNNLKGTESGKKRALDKLNNSSSDENDAKRIKTSDKVMKPTMSARFKKILEATSAHQNLLEQHDNNEQEKYFNKLQKKESMEEKMLNTFKIECKAVRCVKCKYTAFSASQKCKDERHPLKVLDAFKRFFKCGNCGNRTVSLEIIPLVSCSNCNSSKWEKAPMMREKKLTTLSDKLSIRGEEETFVGGQVTAGKNINLLVPDES